MTRILALLAALWSSAALAQTTVPCPPGYPPGARCTTRAADPALATPSLATSLSTADGRRVTAQALLALLPGSSVAAALGYTPLSAAANLADLADKAAARATLGLTLGAPNGPAQLNSSGVLPVTQGGTGASTLSGARVSIGAAASGANADITSLTGLTTAIPLSEGGTGATSAGAARVSLGLATVAATGAYADLSGRPTLGTAAALNVSTGSGGVAASDDSRITGALSSSTAAATYAPLASPALTGTPTAPTAAADTSTAQLATTSYVLGQAGSATPGMDGAAAVGTSARYARQDHVHPTDTTRAPLASPALTGTPTAPTPSTSDNSTRVATTAWGQANLANYFPTSGGTLNGDLTMATGRALRLSNVGLVGDGTNPVVTRNSNTISASNASSIADFASSSTQDALISFDVSGVVASKFGLGADSTFRWGGWSLTPNLMTLDSGGRWAVTNQATVGTGYANQAVIVGAASGTPVRLYATGTGAVDVAVQPTTTGGVLLGNGGSTRGQPCRVVSNGQFAAAGDAQARECILRATSSGSTTPVRMTADGGAPGSANCINIPTRTIMAMQMLGSVTEVSNGGWATFSLPSGASAALIRGDTNAAYAGSSPVRDQAGGDGTTAAMSAAADTTNQCLSLTFTPPNTGAWRAVLRVVTTEVVYP